VTLSLTEAANALGVHVGTVRRDVRNGAPTEELGSVGRGHATRIDLEKYKLWRAERHVPTLTSQVKHDTLQTLTTILLDTLKRDDLGAQVGLSEAQAALAVLMVFERAYKNVNREPLTTDQLPPELKPFHAIVLESLEQGTFHQRR
jgi:hypothetical protein